MCQQESVLLEDLWVKVRCNRVGHLAIDCRVKPEEGRNEYNRPARHAVTCYQCG